jgi:putative endonuclease
MAGMHLGKRGEALAAELLEGRGWQILRRNFRVGRREIDLVARRGEVVAFVEVKTRGGPEFGHPFESITPRKQRGIAAVADGWIQRFGDPSDIYRFDAVAVMAPPRCTPRVEHLENAWGI